MAFFTEITPRSVRSEAKLGLAGSLSKDLEFVRESLNGLSLLDLFKSSGVNRAMEVGPAGEYDNIKSLASLSTDSENFHFKRENLWAVDPVIWSDADLGYLQDIGQYLNRFTRERVRVEKIAEAIKTKEIDPFNFVFCKGVVSIGNLGQKDNVVKTGLTIIDSMVECMNGPGALLLITAKLENTMLPIWKGHLEQRGLEVIGSKPSNPDVMNSWLRLFQRHGDFPTNESVFYNKVLCRMQ